MFQFEQFRRLGRPSGHRSAWIVKINKEGIEKQLLWQKKRTLGIFLCWLLPSVWLRYKQHSDIFTMKNYFSLVLYWIIYFRKSILGGSMSKEVCLQWGDMDSISGLERSPGGRHGNPFQYSCLENPMDREAWWTTVHRVADSRPWLKWPSSHAASYQYTKVMEIAWLHEIGHSNFISLKV